MGILVMSIDSMIARSGVTSCGIADLLCFPDGVCCMMSSSSNR